MLTVSLVIGIVVSILLTELIGISPGGIIVPGYVALVLDQPAALAGFLVISAGTYGILLLLSKVLLLYGSRRFGVTVLVGLALSAGARLTWIQFDPPYIEWAGLGYIVPGLLAYQSDRQGVLPTLLMLAIAAPLVRLSATVLLR